MFDRIRTPGAMGTATTRRRAIVTSVFCLGLACSGGKSSPAGQGDEVTSGDVATSGDVSKDVAASPVTSQGSTTGPGATASQSAAPSHTVTSDEEPASSAPTSTSHDMGSSTPLDDLGAHPFAPSPLSRGGTMTFTNVGAAGWWPRRLDREAGDPACDYKDGSDTWGGHCCMTEHHTTSTRLAPFDEEMTLIFKAIHIKQLAIYQPEPNGDDAEWSRVTSWSSESGTSENLWFTQEGAGSDVFPGDLTKNDCVGYVMQKGSVDCGDNDYFCPNDSGIMHQGFKGSKLVVFLGSMMFDDDAVEACNGDGKGHAGPWVAFVASELVRDGGRKWNGACNCYSKTGSVGDGCGEINVFEVVMDDNAYSNREFASTGVRSFQAGHVGGAVCGESCEPSTFPTDVEVVDACSQIAYDRGPELEVGGDTDGCPVWRRPEGDRYYFVLLDETRRLIQVGVIHPGNLPPNARGLLPHVPRSVGREVIDAMLDLRLPE